MCLLDGALKHHMLEPITVLAVSFFQQASKQSLAQWSEHHRHNLALMLWLDGMMMMRRNLRCGTSVCMRHSATSINCASLGSVIRQAWGACAG
jgi:hypothetical protein